MTITAADIQEALTAGRAAALARMLDTCRITRANRGDFDEESGSYTGTPSIIYEGPCRLVLDSQDTSIVDSQSQILTHQGPRLDLPHIAPPDAVGAPGAVTTNDTAVILTSATDPAHVGKILTIAGEATDTQTTARRLPATAVTGD